MRAAGAGRDHIPLLRMSWTLPNSPHGHVHEETTGKKYNPKQISSHVIAQSIFEQHEDKIGSLQVSLFWSPKWKQTLVVEVAHLRPKERRA